MEGLMFVVGLLIGSLCGVVTMCLLQVNRLHEWKEDKDVSGNPQGE